MASIFFEKENVFYCIHYSIKDGSIVEFDKCVSERSKRKKKEFGDWFPVIDDEEKIKIIKEIVSLEKKGLYGCPKFIKRWKNKTSDEIIEDIKRGIEITRDLS